MNGTHSHMPAVGGRTKAVSVIAALVLLLSGWTALQGQQEPPGPVEKTAVRAAWEKLIKAKGGREKLYVITNMLTEIGSSRTRLDVFPNAFWDFVYADDARAPTGRMGLVERIDLTKDYEYYAREDGLRWTQHYPSRHTIMATRLAYLLETKWDQPELIRLTTRQHGRKLLEVIETKFAGLRSDFVYDPEDLLVNEVDEYDPNGIVAGVLLLSDYAEVGGIQMPRTVAILTNYDQKVWKDPKHNPTYQKISFVFNVEYNPKIFTGPLRAGRKDDWRPKGKAN